MNNEEQILKSWKMGIGRDEKLLDMYVVKMQHKHPDVPVPEGSRRGHYTVRQIKGDYTSISERDTWMLRARGLNKSDVAEVPNAVFFAAVKVTGVGDGRLFGEMRWSDNYVEITGDSAKVVLPLLVNGVITGFWMFRKFGKRGFQLVYLGETEQKAKENWPW